MSLPCNPQATPHSMILMANYASVLAGFHWGSRCALVLTLTPSPTIEAKPLYSQVFRHFPRVAYRSTLDNLCPWQFLLSPAPEVKAPTS
jgi:hypothetical protein